MTTAQSWYVAATSDSDIPPLEGFDHLSFARGYLISKTPRPAPVAHWRTAPIGQWYVAWDPRLAASFVERDGRSLLLLGNVIDLKHEVSGQQVATDLLSAWERSRKHLDESLEWLAGRYIVLGQSEQSEFFQTDATALLSASYASQKQVISSHQNLVAETLGGLPGSHLAEPLPGLATKFAGVRMLTANTELDLRDFSIRRVGPAPYVENQNPREVASAVLDLIRRQFPFLRRPGGGPMVSLTAGLDSRITLAAMRELAPESLYFTYEKRFEGIPDDSERDLDMAKNLANQLGLTHHGYTLHSAELPPELVAVLRRSTSLTHNRAVAASYLRELPQDRLHVRSNLYEVARGYYRNRPRPQIDAEVLARITAGSGTPSPRAIQEFEEMVAVTGVLDVPGYDPLDLYYWEHRMSSWFHKVTLESDIAHDTHILVNSRIILRLMLSVPDDARRSALVFDHLVDLAWPDAYDLPVNGKIRTLPAH